LWAVAGLETPITAARDRLKAATEVKKRFM
jgi:hypothetical protein